MKRYLTLGVVMVIGVGLGIYSLIQMGYWEAEMSRWYHEAKNAESQGQTELAQEYYAQVDRAFENRLIWGSIGTAGVVAGVGCLVWMFWLIMRGETPDPDRVEKKSHEKKE